MPAHVLALDVGGANLKAADGHGFALSRPFELWRQPQALAAALAELLADSPRSERLAVTMTGELADCYATKAEGVRQILDAVDEAAADRAVSVYLVDGRLVDPVAAREVPLLAAASNWHALAAYCCRFLEGDRGLLVDIGSTTTDVIPLTPAGPVATGKTDPERLASGELVYTGTERSPICGLVGELAWQGQPCPVAQEWFATTLDAYLVLGHIPEEDSMQHTADGRPRTIAAAHDRLARMICADRTLLTLADARSAAAEIMAAQLQRLAVAVEQVTGRSGTPAAIILSGSGEFLARRLIEQLRLAGRVVTLSERLGAQSSGCGPAHALAVLAAEQARP